LIFIDSVSGYDQPFQNFILSHMKNDTISIDSVSWKKQSSQIENLPSPKTNNSMIFRIEKSVDRGFSESNDDSGESSSNRINILNGERKIKKEVEKMVKRILSIQNIKMIVGWPKFKDIISTL